MTATVALVHGAWHGAWCWAKVERALEERDIPSVVIDLPGHGDSTDALGDLRVDAEAVRTLLDGIDSEVVLCGHSYGGAVITEVGPHPRVKHLVYLAAFPLDVDESCMSAASDQVSAADGMSELGAAIRRTGDGTFEIDAELAPAVFYNDCDADDAAWSVARLGRHAQASLAQPASVAAWRHIPSTYAVCTEDRAVTPALQRALATRADHVVEWSTGHSPFLSRPELVADLLTELATRD